MDGIETTAGDTLQYYIEDRGKMLPVLQCFDWGSKDFGTIAQRAGEAFTKAEKSHDIGEQAMNAAFKSGMMKIYDDGDEARKLVSELEGLSCDAVKRNAKDDLIDAVRYAITRIPIDWQSVLKTGEVNAEEESETARSRMLNEMRPNAEWGDGKFEEEDWSEEFAEWNDMY